MTILVTGATGFLGSRLVERLAMEGRNVIAIARRAVPSALKSNPRVRWIVRDLILDGLETDGLQDIEAVIHLAGATLGAGKDENLFLCANEQTTVRLCQAMAGRTDRFIFASSQVVYGDACDLGVNEQFPLQPESSAYACSKINSENWLRRFQRHHGGHYLSLRFCGFIEGGGIIDYLIDQALEGAPIELYSKGRIRRDYLSVNDGIDVLITALNHDGEPGFTPVNIGSGQAVSALDLAQLVCAELHSSSKVLFSANESPMGDFVYCLERARKLLDFQPSKLTDAVRRYARKRQAEKRA